MNLSILGSTGSIGTQTLQVADYFDDVKIVGLAANRNHKLLETQIRMYKPLFAALADEHAARLLQIAVADTSTEILSGVEGVCEIAQLTDAHTVVAGMVGISGLLPTVTAIRAGKTIALANKETLVVAGEMVMHLARMHNVVILPVDSEHYAVSQCLGGFGAGESCVNKIILTASGGAFFGKTADEIADVSPEDALEHPNWDMGRKITIDSATLINKAFEVIEAHHLFNIPYEKIDVYVHRESIIHSMVEYNDCSIMAQLSLPDMRLPIQAALTYPKKKRGPMKPLDLAKLGRLTFALPDRETFPLLNIGVEAGKVGGSMPVVLNAANEVAVEWFLKGRIKFPEIAKKVEQQLEKHTLVKKPGLEEIIEIDAFIKKKMK